MVGILTLLHQKSYIEKPTDVLEYLVKRCPDIINYKDEQILHK